ncbi:piggyBac transposable element-derived protein 3-like [Palaemon carinicauda]|uniref:piggyBac transposable element-derived protein 3-like n=1 Tax=Palaemon carinicauda TaxID=392227 RepID=UPI0035B58E97
MAEKSTTFSRKERLTLNEIYDLLDELDNEEVDISVNPPLEDPDADTDQDSDASDDEVTCNPDHLPRRILATDVAIDIARHVENDSEKTNDEEFLPSTSKEPAKKRQRKGFEWHRNKMRVNNAVPDFVQQPNEEIDKLKEKVNNPVDCINLFWTEQWIEELCHQSTIYAEQKSLSKDHITPQNMKIFLSVLILSGYNKLPYRRMYWSETPDVFNNLVSESIRRDTFDKILRSLHFADNMKMTDDRFYKVRPLFQHLNSVSNLQFQQEFHSIDEIMIPYYGKHGAKQFIRGKPVRFGFKVWAACTSDGSLLYCEPYCGSDTKIPDIGLGQGPNVVVEMSNKNNLQAGQHAVFDNLFTSLPLLENLANRGIGGTGTLREDRLHGAPLMEKKEMEKKKYRGYMEEAFTGSTSVVKWKDNKVVSVASNKVRMLPVQKTGRWSKLEKKHIEVDMPNSIQVYNKQMGGVDIFDQQVSAYRIRIRSKKWWWPIFAWSINAQVVNSWMLYRKLGNTIPLLDFIRHFVIAIMKQYGAPRTSPGPKRLSVGIAKDSVRYNGEQHWTKKGEQRHSRCRECSRRTKYICNMCSVPLHPECMEPYHKIHL